MNCFELLFAALSIFAGILTGAWIAESHAWYIAVGSGLLASLTVFGSVNLMGQIGGLLHKRRKRKKKDDSP
jgi:thiosulfate reductase cytochrome b subunit